MIAGCRFRIRRLDARQSTNPVDQYHRRAVIQPCNARGAHGFFRQDRPAVAAIIAFIKSR